MKLYFFLAAIFLGFLVSCDPADNRFTLINTSQKTVGFCLITVDSADKSALEFYSEGFYFTTDSTRMSNEYQYIRPGEKRRIGTIGNWELELQDYPKGKDFIYIIDSSDIGKNSDTLQHEKLIRKYHVSYDYMKSHNWQFEIK